MNAINRRRYDVLTQVRDFGATYGHLLPESTPASQAFAAVNAAIASIEAHDVAETTASVAARGRRTSAARQALQDQLALIARTAQVLPGADADFQAQFKLSGWQTDQLLLRAARQCIQHATPGEAQFIAYGLRPTFLTDLGALIQRFEEAVRGRGASRSQRVAAGTAIKEALTTAFAAIRELDVMVANQLASNAVAREVWKRARRIRYPVTAQRGSAPKPVAPDASSPEAVENPASAGA